MRCKLRLQESTIIFMSSNLLFSLISYMCACSHSNWIIIAHTTTTCVNLFININLITLACQPTPKPVLHSHLNAPVWRPKAWTLHSLDQTPQCNSLLKHLHQYTHVLAQMHVNGIPPPLIPNAPSMTWPVHSIYCGLPSTSNITHTTPYPDLPQQ